MTRLPDDAPTRVPCGCCACRTADLRYGEVRLWGILRRCDPPLCPRCARLLTLLTDELPDVLARLPDAEPSSPWVAAARAWIARVGDETAPLPHYSPTLDGGRHADDV